MAAMQTPGLRRALLFATNLCKGTGGKELQPEHCLIGILTHSVGIAKTVLERLNIDTKELSDRVAGQLETGEDFNPKQPTYSVETAAIFETYMPAIAAAAGRNSYSTDDLLLAIYRQPDTFASRVLHELIEDESTLIAAFEEERNSWPKPSPETQRSDERFMRMIAFGVKLRRYWEKIFPSRMSRKQARPARSRGPRADFSADMMKLRQDAESEAELLGQVELAPEHYLLALVRGRYPEIDDRLKQRGVESADFVLTIQSQLVPGKGPVMFSTGGPPPTPELKSLLASAKKIAKAKGVSPCDIPHLITAMRQQEGSIAAELLGEA